MIVVSRVTQPRLTKRTLCESAPLFAEEESSHWEPSIYGRTDGKAGGTHIEQKFTAWLSENFRVTVGNSASGIDLPELNVDIELAEEILLSVPPQGFLTISNALQWRLQYGRVIEVAGTQAGVFRCDS
jgi:hypothetical protein